jgi:hypothetical protein
MVLLALGSTSEVLKTLQDKQAAAAAAAAAEGSRRQQLRAGSSTGSCTAAG